MPKPMHRSRSMRRLSRVTPKGRNVVHYERRKGAFPHCPLCGAELNGISNNSMHSKGRSLRTNSRKFGGVLCAGCTANVIKLASRIEQGEMKLNDISVRQKEYVLQMIAH